MMPIMLSEYQLKENYLLKNGWIRDKQQADYWTKPCEWRIDTFYLIHTDEAFKIQRDWNLK